MFNLRNRKRKNVSTNLENIIPIEPTLTLTDNSNFKMFL